MKIGVESTKQIWVLLAMIVVQMAAVVVFVFVPGGAMEQMAALTGPEAPQLTPAQMAIGNVVQVIVLYTLTGLVGLWLARKLGWPGIFRQGAGLSAWLWRPLILGCLLGAAMVAIDLLVRVLTGSGGLDHPAFPASVLASLIAGIGEEIMFRLFLMSLWAVILSWVLGRLFPGRNTRVASLWLANGMAALLFAVGHIPSVMALQGVDSLGALPPGLLFEIFVLNVIVGLAAGRAFAREGLVAASGIHFWADIVWHVIYGGLG